jgi:hypothetical protein
LVKDVPALFERDPSLPGPPPRRYEIASWQDAIGTDGTIVQHKAVRFAWSLGLRFELASLNSDAPSVIGGERSVLSAPVAKPSPLRVAVLGLGSVGRGVYEHLLRLPGEFVVTGVSARHAGKHPDIPASLFVPDAVALAGQNADVVVEAIGGIEPAMKAAVATLRRGAHFVTANKALIAAHGDELKALARASGGSLRYSAAVGGGVPVLEPRGGGADRCDRGGAQRHEQLRAGFVRIGEFARGCGEERAGAGVRGGGSVAGFGWKRCRGQAGRARGGSWRCGGRGAAGDDQPGGDRRGAEG